MALPTLRSTPFAERMFGEMLDRPDGGHAMAIDVRVGVLSR